MAFNKKTFTAKVVALEIEQKRSNLDMRQYVHDRSAELEGDEKSIILPSFTPGATTAMPIADDDMANGSTEAEIELVLDQDVGYPIVVGNSEQSETNVALMNTRAAGGAMAHRTTRNKHLLASIAGTAASATNRLKYADTTGNVISLEDILNAAAMMDDASVPQEDRYLAIRALDHKHLMKIEGFISRDKMGQNAEALPKNVIGLVGSFTVLKVPSSQMPLLNASTGAVATTGKNCAIFFQMYATAYAENIYKLVGPELKAGADAEWYNLHAKYGSKAQNDTFAVTYREN